MEYFLKIVWTNASICFEVFYLEQFYEFAIFILAINVWVKLFIHFIFVIDSII